MTSDAVIAQAARILGDAGIDDAHREARILWRATPDDDVSTYMAKIALRAERRPLSHVLGYRDFYKHRFVVTQDVLDPRPDTETLVAAALGAPFERVLDLGTGSGCILLSLLGDMPVATGVGADISLKALDVAAINADRLDLGDRARFVLSHWFEAIEGRFDLIVSNPPYISAAEMKDLQPEVRLFEPHLALTDDGDGLGAYRAIVESAPEFLTPNGRLIFETGATQGAVVADLMAQAGFAAVKVIPDINGRDRVVSGQNRAV